MLLYLAIWRCGDNTIGVRQLYRTLIHEFGHYKQYLEIVERAGHEDEDFEEWNKRNKKYFKISSSDMESDAHRYADELIKKLREENIVPYDRISDIDSDEKNGA